MKDTLLAFEALRDLPAGVDVRAAGHCVLVTREYRARYVMAESILAADDPVEYVMGEGTA